MKDFIIVGGQRYGLLPGYEVALAHSEVSNIKTMASGMKRKDFLRKSTKIKFTYKTATQEILDKINAIYEKSLACDDVGITVGLQMGTAYEEYKLSIIGAPEYGIAFRGTRVFYSNLKVELE